MITSAENSRIKEIMRLQAHAKTRRESGLFVTEGRKLFEETPAALREAVYVSASFEKEAADDSASILQGISYEVMDDRLFQKCCDTKTPQGILTIARMPSFTREDLLSGTVSAPKGGAPNPEKESHIVGTAETGQKQIRILLLEDIQDPGNLGTIIRTAEAAGVSGVILSRGCADPFQPKVVRSTMGSIFRVPLRIEDDFLAAAAWLKKQGVRLYATDLQAETSYKDTQISPRAGYLLGNEGNGLSEAALALADARIRIPMAGKVESLNVAIATAILLFT